MFAACYKIAARKNCNLQVVNLWVYVGSLIAVLGSVAVEHGIRFSMNAMWLGIASGIAAFFATLTFFFHMQFGKLSASWTVISLSLAFPVVASILIWHESPSLKQGIGLLLIVVALLLFGRHEVNLRGNTE